MLLTTALDRSSILLAQQDSSSLTVRELQQTLGLLNELEYRRTESNIWMDKESVYKSLIQNYQSNEELYEREIKNLELNIEAVKPAWYDNFWTGAAITGIVISSIYFLTR